MTTVVPISRDDERLEAASRWVLKIDDGALSTSDRAALGAWLDENPSHRDVLLEVAAVWDKTDSLSRLADFFPHEAEPDAEIPDQTPAGVTSTIEITDQAVIQSLAVQVEVTHPYRGDLSVIITHPEGDEVTLHKREGRNATDLSLNVSVPEWVGRPLQGEWTLQVIDHAEGDVGRLVEWSLSAQVSR